MLESQSAVYFGHDKEGYYMDFMSERTYFLAIEIEGLSKEEGSKVLSDIKNELHTTTITHLSQLQELVERVKHSSQVSIAVGAINNNIFYLCTLGKGQIFLSREGNFAKIIEGDKSASGFIKPDDIFIFTSSQFTETAGSEDNLKLIFNGRKPREIVDTLILQLKDKEDAGTIALFVSFETKSKSTIGGLLVYDDKTIDEMGAEKPSPYELEDKEYEEETKTPPATAVKPKKKLSMPKINVKNLGFKIPFFQRVDEADKPRKKYLLTFGVVFVIFAILIWSVVLGYKRRQSEALQKEINSTKQLVTQQLAQADDVSFLNMSRALELIKDARSEVDDLKSKTNGKPNKDIDDLEKLVSDKEARITKKEDKSYDEFYDLSVDTKDATGSKMYLDADNAVILDSSGGRIYTLSFSKKSLNKSSSSDVKNATIVALSDDKVLFYKPNSGIYSVTDGKTKKVIENDSEWGDIKDMQLYNGNIYLLDSGNSEIYKYVSSDNSYSNKSAYFKGGEGGLKDATSMAIDSSVYVSLKDSALKFTSGAQDTFKTTYPDKSVSIMKIITSKDLNNVFEWDKAKGAIYVLEKSGTYVKQIQSSVLSKADDVVVYENNAYILVKQKIFKMGVQ